MFYWGLAVGLFIGCFVGIFIAGLCVMAKEAHRQDESWQKDWRGYYGDK